MAGEPGVGEGEEATGAGVPIYSPEYYRRIRDLEDRHWWYLGMREIARALLSSRGAAGKRAAILDAGCGTGGGLAWARGVCGAQTVVGVDVSWHALEFCRQRGERGVLQASVVQAPFRDNCFDLILCNDVLQHLPTDGTDVLALREMHRTLRPGGHLLVRSNSRLGMVREGRDRDPDFQRYTLGEVAERLRAAGFLVRRATYANTVPSVYAAVRGALRRWRRNGGAGRSLYQGLRIRQCPAWLNRLLLGILRAEARYLAHPAHRSRFGHTTMCLGEKPGQ